MDHAMFFTHVTIELIGNLLFFALLVSCAAKWRQRTVIASLPVVYLAFWLTGVIGVLHPNYSALGYGNWFLVSLPLYVTGFAAIAFYGRRRSSEQLMSAATWPRFRLLAGFVFSFVVCGFTYTSLSG